MKISASQHERIIGKELPRAIASMTEPKRDDADLRLLAIKRDLTTNDQQLANTLSDVAEKLAITTQSCNKFKIDFTFKRDADGLIMSAQALVRPQGE